MAAARKVLLFVFLGLPLLALFLHTLVRMVRAFYKFPMPQFTTRSGAGFSRPRRPRSGTESTQG